MLTAAQVGIIVTISCLFAHLNAYQISPRFVQARIPTALFFFCKKAVPSTTAFKVPKEELDLALRYWNESYNMLKPASLDYLTPEAFKKKFEIVAKAIGSKNVIVMLQNDASFFTYRTERITESFSAWSNRLNSSDEAIALCIRNPPVLSIKPFYIEKIGGGQIAQTYFWSYVAVAFRPVTISLQKLIRG
jgi:hypothetical protein